MIKLSRMSDYALVVLEMLSRNSGAPLSAPQIAEGAGLPEPTVAKVLKQMATGGLVTSVRGVNGGYAIARPAGEISVFDIVSAIEGRLSLTACVEGHDEPCALEGACAMTGRWNPVNAAVRGAFESITLADMVSKKAVA
ncbi:MAG: SUF system Fe-S cluster assembly regulator [Alphaproteobacteria bacterium]|nr:SUF system Fe-S cluster assembly regulator [Alphaproteobacteria bacterium]